MASLTEKLFAVVKAVRLRYVAPLLVLLIAAYLVVIHPWMLNWGSTVAERQMALAGDSLYPGRTEQYTQAITINAPTDAVWPWLVQVGQDKGGFYTYTWLENIFGVDIHNADTIHPEWQQLSVGDSWRLAPRSYLWGLGEEAVTPVRMLDPGHALVLDVWGAYVLEPIDAHTTRLISRGHSAPPGPLLRLVNTMVWEPVVMTMNHRMLLGLQARAEGRPDTLPVLAVIAQVGWAVAGVAVAGLFLTERRRRYWLVLPLAATLPALLMAHDVQAGLAAFLAVGITVLGFLVFGRSWWGPLLLVAAGVLLTLLLAANAYVVLGFVFTLLVVGALVVILVGNARTRRRTALSHATGVQAGTAR
jgi:hypothetical protein